MVNHILDLLKVMDRYIGRYPIYLYLVDSSNSMIWMNRSLSAKIPDLITGQQLACGKSLWPCVPKCDDCARGEVQLRPEIEKRLIRKSFEKGEEESVIEFFSIPIVRSKDEELEGVLRLGIDVTDNERMQEFMREKEKIYKTIINTSTDAVVVLDNDYNITSWNRGAAEMFGYSAEEISGKSVRALIPVELQQLGEHEYIQKELEANGLIKRYETQRLTRDGRSLYVDVSSTRIFDENGAPIGTSEIIKDIDSRKELEFELLRTILELSKLNELNDILHSTYDETEILRIILIAITAGEGLRFNRAFLLMVDEPNECLRGHLAIGPSDEDEADRIWSELNKDYHYLKDIVQIYQIDLQGTDKKVNEIVHQIEVPIDDSDHILIQAYNKKQILEVQDGELLGRGECSFRSGDSDLMELLNSRSFVVAPLFSRHESLGVIIADNCINQREISTEDVEGLKLFASQASTAIENARLYKTLEQRIQDVQSAYQSLEKQQEQLLKVERLAAIGEMSAKIAHEIRNPLVSIGGFARRISTKMPVDSEAKQYASIISDQVSTLETILNNILGMANPPTPQRDQVNIKTVIEHVLSMMQAALDSRKITVATEFDHDDTFIFGDEKLLHQALLNIVKNAIEALDGITEGRIDIQTSVNKANVEVIISDNGVGIATSAISKIFQTFFTTKSSGAGLGLSIVKQIVESHGGKIDVRGRAEGGTNAHFKFPIQIN